MRGTIVNTIYTGTASMRLINLAVDPDEQYLYFSNLYDRTLYSYNIADNVRNVVKIVNTGVNPIEAVSVSTDAIFTVRTSNVSPYVSLVYAITPKREIVIAGGGSAASGSPQQLRICGAAGIVSCGFAVDPTTGFLYVSTYDNPGSKIYQIQLVLLPRPLPTVAPPKQRQVECGLAEFGTCKRVTIPFNPRERWGWGSPNRPYFTPDPNVGCPAAYVFTGDHPCPDVRQPVLPIPPPPPVAPPPIIEPYTEHATTDFASRSFNYLTTGISSLTLVATICSGTTSRPSAPALGPYGELYMLTSNGNIYSLLAGLSNSTGDSLVDTSPAVSITTGNVAVASSNLVTVFDASLNFLWSSNIAGCFSPAFGNNSVVFFANDSNIYAIDSVTRSNVWTRGFSGGETVTSPPTADSGIMLLGTSVGNVYSIDQTTGNIIWRYGTGLNAAVYSVPNYTWNDRVVFASGSNIFNIDYDRIPPYDRTRTYVAVSNIAGSFATSFDPSGNLWCYYTASGTLFGVSMLDDSGNYVGWSSAPLAGLDVMSPGFTPTMDPFYVYATSQRGRVMRYSAFPSGLVSNAIVQKSYVNSYLIPSTIITAPSTVTTASNQLVVFDTQTKAYIFQ